MFSRYCDILPPSGNLGWTFLKYTCEPKVPWKSASSHSNVRRFHHTVWLVRLVYHQAVSKEGLVGTVIPGGGGRGSYTWHDTVTTRMICALRWATPRIILTFHSLWLWGAKSQDRVHKPQLLNRKVSWSRELNQCDPLTSLPPYHWAKPAHWLLGTGAITNHKWQLQTSMSLILDYSCPQHKRGV